MDEIIQTSGQQEASHISMGGVLAELRKARRLSQKALADFAGHSESLIEKAENEKRILSPEVISDVCSVLEIPDLDPRMNLLLLAAAHASIAVEQTKREIRFVAVDSETTQKHKAILDGSIPFRFKLVQLRGALSRVELEKLTGVSESEITKSEGGTRVPRAEIIARICCARGVPLGDPLLDKLLLEASYLKIKQVREKRHGKPLSQPLRP